MKMISALIGVTISTVVLAQLSAPIKITVEKQQKIERAVKQKASEKGVNNGTVYHPEVADRNQAVVFNVKLQNAGREWKGLTVKYVLLGRDINTRKIEVAATGTETVDLRPLQVQIFETKPATFTRQETKYTSSGFSELDRQSGKKYYGIAVAVYSGNQKVAALYEPHPVEKDIADLDKDF